MIFDPESIERLSPAARVEVQDFYARRFLAARERRMPDRRVAKASATPNPEPAVANPAPRQRWPRTVWFRNDTSRRVQAAADSSSSRR
jgi:hypothetical protein